MIYSFSCKNFYSFKDETVLSFEVNNNAPKNDGYFETPFGTRLSKIETIIGPNASGKTNLLKAIPFLKWIIVDSFTADPESLISIQPFIFGKSKEKPIEISVVFEVNKIVYRYTIVVTKEKIIREELISTCLAKKKRTSKKVFMREWDEKDGKYILDLKNLELPKEFRNLLRKNSSIIGAAALLNHDESKEIINYWKQIQVNVIEAGWIDDPYQKSNDQFIQALIFFNKNKNIKDCAEKIISDFDLGLNGLEIKEIKKYGSLSLDVQSIHVFENERYLLPIKYASAGTKQLIILLKNVLTVLEKGGTAVIDEIDTSLHPEILIALHDLFIQPETNPENAQLLMSTHSHTILNELDKYQIVLVEKDENGISEAWRLDSISNIRADDNHYSKYLAGAYGAVPKI